MTYSVIGTGGIGGYYGGRLAASGQTVRFLLHSDYEYVKQNGLQVDSCRGNFHLDRVEADADVREMPHSDVVLVGLKSVNNHLLPEMLRAVVTPQTVVVLIQNGIGLEADLQAAMPDLQIVAGLAFICTAKTGPGHISHYDYGHINLGNYSCRDAARFETLLGDFRAAGIEAAEVDYAEARWKKAVWNMPFNGMTVALNTTTDALLANESTRRLIREQMMEVIGAARACGVAHIDASFADQMIEMTEQMTPYSPSMKLDFDYRRPMEIPYLYTRPIAEARKKGFEMPRLAMLEAQLRFIEWWLSAG